MKHNQPKTKRYFYLVFALFLLQGGLANAQWTESGGNITTSDNVGIGTTSPGTKLDVSGGNIRTTDGGWFEATEAGFNGNNGRMVRLYQAGATGAVFESTYWSGGYTPIILKTSGAEQVRIDTAGNVGIGTTSPGTKLDVSGGNIRTTDGGWFEATEAGFNGNNGRMVRLYQAGATGAVFESTYWSGGYTPIILKTSGAEQVRIDTAGNVGIGTTSPSSKLHVAGDAKMTGNVTVDGNIAAKYQDVAEWVRTGTVLEPGTVVVIDPARDDQVQVASQPYDTRVAGVVSAQPGVILGEPGEDKVKVAHGGRVKVKADARFGPIQVGDLLVSSGTLGHAMRSAPVEVNGISLHRPGTIVGKALEPLKEGQGEILVLLTLQ